MQVGPLLFILPQYVDARVIHSKWSEKDQSRVQEDLKASVEKCQAALQLVNSVPNFEKPRRILEIGCGFGQNLAYLQNAFNAELAVGCDFSGAALEVAQTRFGSSSVRFIKTPLDISETVRLLKDPELGKL